MAVQNNTRKEYLTLSRAVDEQKKKGRKNSQEM
jgi:hypothetical protein